MSHIEVLGQRLRVAVRPGRRPALLLFNGIGANFELLDPFLDALGDVESIVFDIPGTGGSAARWRPYRLRDLARLAAQLLDALGYHEPVDALGVSWGGALAQQFAFSQPQRCRRLVLAATTPGVLMVPGSPSVLLKLASPRRYLDMRHLRRIAGDLYGGAARHDPTVIMRHGEAIAKPHALGYFYQQLAFCTWSSLPWLGCLRQPTLVLAGRDDPLVPLINARVLARLITRSRLEVLDDGHLFLMSSAKLCAPLVREFLAG